MKIIKTVVGILAVLYALAQAVNLTIGLVTHRMDFGSSYATGQVIGSVTGIVLGSLIAVACLRKNPEKKAS